MRRVRRVLAALLAAAAVYTAFQAVSIWRYGSVDEKCPADVAVVLGAGTYNGEVSPVYQARIDHGIWLYENGYVEKLILTGGFGAGSTVSDAAATKRYAVSAGMPEWDILLEERSAITQENLQYAQEIMAEAGYGKAVIVSDPLHMKRLCCWPGTPGSRHTVLPRLPADTEA